MSNYKKIRSSLPFDIGTGILSMLVILFLFCAILGFIPLIVMWLWNWIIPTIFPIAGVITYWQAVGLFLLVKILTINLTSKSE